MVVRALEQHDGSAFRAIRLRALQSDPDAFRSTYEVEAAYDDDAWRDFLAPDTGGRVFIAESRGEPVGITGVRAADGPDSAILWGMWVSPDARGSGVGRALVEAAVEWARISGAGDVILEVAQGNEAAKRLYTRCGFQDIGQAPLRPDDPCSLATMMRKTLRPPG
jgi:GNAT superfamily N-acetyltransferase